MARSAEQMRAWQGPALLTYGFRPFFLGAAVWAFVCMVAWIGMLSGQWEVPTGLDMVSWHAHEFLFGYVSAVIAGFLLTAVPNWTGRLPIVGWPLGALFGLWIAGRIAVTFSAHLPAVFVAVVDLSMMAALAGVIAREIIAGKNWRNLMVLGMLSVLLVGNGVFHVEAAGPGFAAQGYGLRLGLGASIMMIAVVGGRVVPSFTRNWMAKRQSARLPVPPMQRFDKVALLALLGALGAWIALPASQISALLLLLAGGLHLARLWRWLGMRTLAEPLVTVLHVGYLFVPLGAFALGAEPFLPGTEALGGVQHFWMAGAIGVMTLAVMTRATLGHTGHALTAGPGTMLIYGAAVLAVLLRVMAGVWPEQATGFYWAAGMAWLTAFGSFVVVYGPLLARARPMRAS